MSDTEDAVPARWQVNRHDAARFTDAYRAHQGTMRGLDVAAEVMAVRHAETQLQRLITDPDVLQAALTAYNEGRYDHAHADPAAMGRALLAAARKILDR